MAKTTGIQVVAEYSYMLWGAAFAPVLIEIDTVKHKEKWGTHLFETAAGLHYVRICYNMGLGDCYPASANVVVEDGNVTSVRYKLPSNAFQLQPRLEVQAPEVATVSRPATTLPSPEIARPDPVSSETPKHPCSSCGRMLAPGARFCQSCGTAVPKVRACPVCGHEQVSGKFCGACGAPMAAAAATV